MNAIWTLLTLLTLVYGIMTAFLYFKQTNFIYFPNIPSRQLSTTPERQGLAYEEVTLTTADRVKINGWYLPVANARATLLFLHGNAGNISHRIGLLGQFNRLGLAVMIIDYRGYGNSEGEISEQGSYRDAEAAWRFLTESKAIAPSDIIIFGRSLGGSVAAWLAARNPARGLVIESAFTSVPDMAAELYPIFPTRLLTRFDYDTRRYLTRVRIPVMIMHGRGDEIVPLSHARALLQAANMPKQLIELDGGHDDAHAVSSKDYLAAWNDFIEAIE